MVFLLATKEIEENEEFINKRVELTSRKAPDNASEAGRVPRGAPEPLVRAVASAPSAVTPPPRRRWAGLTRPGRLRTAATEHSPQLEIMLHGKTTKFEL